MAELWTFFSSLFFGDSFIFQILLVTACFTHTVFKLVILLFVTVKGLICPCMVHAIELFKSEEETKTTKHPSLPVERNVDLYGML